MRRPLLFLAALAGACLWAACGGKAPTEQAQTHDATPPSPLLLHADLPAAVPVMEARKAKAGASVTTFGRVREEVEGSGKLILIDASVPFCGQAHPEQSACPTPWDYCCHPDQIAAGSLAVEIRDAAGKVVTLGHDDVRRLDLVAMKGTLEKGADGDPLLVVHGGWYRRERPKLPSHVKWPKE
jgi:hypothetical protein